MEETRNRSVRKAGRTLLVRVQSNDFDSSMLSQMRGVSHTHHNESSNSFFLTFDTVKNSLSALRELKKNHGNDVRVKFAYYRVFFTMDGLESSTDYNTVKTQHRQLVNELSMGNVLYYKLYRKNDNYVGCGDMTVDTKELFDHLMSDENGMKTFSLECGLNGTHYRYRSNRQQQVATA